MHRKTGKCTHVQGSHVAVRSAACEALGVLYSECGLEVLPDDDDELLSGDGGSVSTASLDGSACAVSEGARGALETGFHGVLARIDDLARNRCGLCLGAPPPPPRITRSGGLGKDATCFLTDASIIAAVVLCAHCACALSERRWCHGIGWKRLAVWLTRS